MLDVLPAAHHSMASAAVGEIVAVDDLTKVFTTKGGVSRRALDNISLRVKRGEFVVVVGPSGCGKTTLLRCVAGLEHGDQGAIRIHGKTVYAPAERISLPPESRNLSMVFQSYALWPHMTVLDNVAYPLVCRKKSKSEAREAARNILGMLGLSDRIDAYPAQMSGGQQQRVALARAMVAGSDLVLFDEPLSNLDAQVRERIRSELASLQREHGFAALYVTHDQSEAMGLADTLVVMRNGKIEQIGSPHEVYSNPVSSYVGGFLGRANQLEGTILASSQGEVSLSAAIGTVVGRTPGGVSLLAGAKAVALVRPEYIKVSREHDPGAVNSARATVVSSRFLGGITEHELDVGDNLILAREPHDQPLPVGSVVSISLPIDKVNILAA